MRETIICENLHVNGNLYRLKLSVIMSRPIVQSVTTGEQLAQLRGLDTLSSEPWEVAQCLSKP